MDGIASLLNHRARISIGNSSRKRTRAADSQRSRPGSRSTCRLVPLGHVAVCWLIVSIGWPVVLSAGAEPGWEPLFDGKTLSGWVQRGGNAKYHVQDGVIVGTTVPGTPNSFLCTERSFADFILELEFKVDPRLNSGIQIRSNSFPEYDNGRVHGYQVEIDPSERAWSAGIYDEGRRGWLHPLDENEHARKAFRQNDWNHYRVVAIGDSIKTWINGVPAADLVDSMTQAGFIGLQVHSTREKEPLHVRWRNIHIRNLGRHEWKALFDGQSLQGWRDHGGDLWQVKDGAIVGTLTRDHASHAALRTERQFDDLTARLKFKLAKGSAGVFFRAKDGSPGGPKGFLAKIGLPNNTGGLRDTTGRGQIVKPSAEAIKGYRPGEWTELTISARGPRIVVHVNGQRAVDLQVDSGQIQGFLALYLDGSADTQVAFKDIEILVPLKQPEPAEGPGTP